MPANNTRTKRLNKRRRAEFEKLIKSEGQWDYFCKCLKERNAGTTFKGLPTAKHYYVWAQETVKRWGFGPEWEPAFGIVVPPEAPPPVNKAKLPRNSLVAIEAAGTLEPLDPNELPDLEYQDKLEFNEMVKWTLGVLDYEPDTIPKSKRPGPGALNMLRFARSDKGRDKFFGWVKQIQDDEQVANQVKRTFEDDKRKHFLIMSKILDDLARKKSEESTKFPQST